MNAKQAAAIRRATKRAAKRNKTSRRNKMRRENRVVEIKQNKVSDSQVEFNESVYCLFAEKASSVIKRDLIASKPLPLSQKEFDGLMLSAAQGEQWARDSLMAIDPECLGGTDRYHLEYIREHGYDNIKVGIIVKFSSAIRHADRVATALSSAGRGFYYHRELGEIAAIVNSILPERYCANIRVFDDRDDISITIHEQIPGKRFGIGRSVCKAWITHEKGQFLKVLREQVREGEITSIKIANPENGDLFETHVWRGKSHYRLSVFAGQSNMPEAIGIKPGSFVRDCDI